MISCGKTTESNVPFYNTAGYAPIWHITQKSKDSLHRIPFFKLTDQNGTLVSTEDVKGKIYLANFFFTSCKGICPKMTQNIKKVYDHFQGNDQVAFLSYSVTPEIDSIAKLRQFASANGIKGTQWHLLTGNVTEIYNLARKGYFVEEADGLSKDSTEFLHTENIVLVDGDGHLRGLYNGTLPVEAERMITDINLLLKEDISNQRKF